MQRVANCKGWRCYHADEDCVACTAPPYDGSYYVERDGDFVLQQPLEIRLDPILDHLRRARYHLRQVQEPPHLRQTQELIRDLERTTRSLTSTHIDDHCYHTALSHLHSACILLRRFDDYTGGTV